MERLIPFQFRPVNVSGYFEIDFDNYRFLVYELYLHLIAACIRTRQYETAANIIESEFHFPRTLGGGDYFIGSAADCCERVNSLEDQRNRRLKLNLQSVTASLIRDRAPCGPITFAEILQADLLLYVRYWFPEKGHFSHWFPHCAPYAFRSGAIELFARAATPRGFEPLKTLLRVQNLDALLDGFDALFAGQQSHGLEFGVRQSIPIALNVIDLRRIAGRER